MVSIVDLKTYILEENMIESVLEGIGCHHIKRKSGYYQCANPDGDNQTAVCVYENDNLTVVDYTRDIAPGKTSADIITLVQFFTDLSFPKAVNQICSWVCLDYYHDFEADLPRSVSLTKELLALQGDSVSEYEDKPVKPIPEKILSYYANRVNQPFADDGISYLTQQEWEIGFDESTNRITSPFGMKSERLSVLKGACLLLRKPRKKRKSSTCISSHAHVTGFCMVFSKHGMQSNQQAKSMWAKPKSRFCKCGIWASLTA